MTTLTTTLLPRSTLTRPVALPITGTPDHDLAIGMANLPGHAGTTIAVGHGNCGGALAGSGALGQVGPNECHVITEAIDIKNDSCIPSTGGRAIHIASNGNGQIQVHCQLIAPPAPPVPPPIAPIDSFQIKSHRLASIDIA